MKKFIRKIPGYNYGKKVYYGFSHAKRQIRNMLAPTARILLYHRVAEAGRDPHLLCVSPDNFRAQIKFLKENYKIIPLVKLVHDIRAGKVQRNSIVITFDDGYADNLYNALPVLEEYNAPATVFLVASYIDSNRPFYWDLPDRPASPELQRGEQAGENSPQEGRGRPMTLDEAKQLSNSRLIEIGGHTMTHPNLGKLAENEQFEELDNSKKILEKMLDLPLLSFAYPFGDDKSFSDKTISLVKRSGYHYACSNIHERATNKSDIYALPRFVVRDWTLKEFKRRLESFI